jgi:hypothetical protein
MTFQKLGRDIKSMRGYNYQSHKGEAIIYEYLRSIKNKDINRLMRLFVDDAIFMNHLVRLEILMAYKEEQQSSLSLILQ